MGDLGESKGVVLWRLDRLLRMSDDRAEACKNDEDRQQDHQSDLGSGSFFFNELVCFLPALVPVDGIRPNRRNHEIEGNLADFRRRRLIDERHANGQKRPDNEKETGKYHRYFNERLHFGRSLFMPLTVAQSNGDLIAGEWLAENQVG